MPQSLAPGTAEHRRRQPRLRNLQPDRIAAGQRRPRQSDELLLDYEDFSRQRGHAQWKKDSAEGLAVRKVGWQNGKKIGRIGLIRPIKLR